MDDLIKKKEKEINEKEIDIETLKNTINELKKGNRYIVLAERKKLYVQLRDTLRFPMNYGIQMEKLRKEEIDECNEILEEFDNKFNISEDEIIVGRHHKYRFSFFT
jgi:hypothetical protein